MFKKIKENKMLAISIIAILFIPVMYAGNFLFAFADPYNNLTNVPVAIVNDDNGTNYNGEDINVGKEFIEGLKESNNFKWNFVTDSDALSGMEDNEYYFTVKIPSNFSENIYSTLNGTKKDANLIYMANDNKNYICGVLGSALVNELESTLNKNIISGFLTNLDTNLLDGTSNLSSAVKEIYDGSSTISTNLGSLRSGANELLNSTGKLVDGSNTLTSGINTLSTKYTTFDSNLSTAVASLNQVNNGYISLNNSMATYRSSLVAALNASGLPNDTIQGLIGNYDAIYANSTYLNQNLNKVDLGMNSLSTNSKTINTKLIEINSGSSTLNSYLVDLNTGAKKLYDGTNSLYYGSSKLTSGVNELGNGISTFSNEITNLKLTENSKNIASPVTRTDQPYSAVDNYAYGFAPYFISLGLFVGALVTTIVLSMKEKKAKEKGTTKNSLRKLGLFASIVTVQALVLDIVLMTTNILVDNKLLLIGFSILIALTFMAIVQMFTTLFNDVGRFLCIILLTLQLTACGGTFPIETAPKFYNLISPYMPMTYTVDALRSIIGSGNMSIVLSATIILVSIIVVCYGLIFIYFKRSNKYA